MLLEIFSKLKIGNSKWTAIALTLTLFIPLTIRASTPTVVINEIAWMGTTTSANDEWLELYNTSDETIDLTNWQVQTADDGINVTLTGNIPARGYYLLERTDDASAPGASADIIYTGSLANDGETLKLLNAAGEIINTLDAAGGWSAGDNATKQTLERAANGAWQTSAIAGGTPKTINSNPTPTDKESLTDETDTDDTTPTSTPNFSTTEQNGGAAIKRDEIIITEILPNPIGPDDNEFIELKNASVRAIDLTNWTINTSGGQRYILPSLIMYPKSIVVFNRATTRLALRNDREKIILKTAVGNIITQIEWKKSAPEGKSYQRVSDGSYGWESPTPSVDALLEPIITPSANIIGPTRATVGDIISFDGSDSFDPLNRPLTLRWQLGDGRVADGPIVRQFFSAAGKYDITLTAFVDEQASSTEVLKITITGDNNTPSDATTTAATTEMLPPNTEAIFTVNNVFLSEFLPNPDGSDDQEFIELFNADGIAVDLGGWQIDDALNGSRPYHIPAGTIIAPGQYRAFYKTETRVALNNDNDEARLLSPDGTEIDVATYEDVTEGASYVLTENGDWEQTNTPTPNELNVLAPTADTVASSTATTSPRIMGTATAEEIAPPAPNNTLRYIISGATALTILGLTATMKKRRR